MESFSSFILIWIICLIGGAAIGASKGRGLDGFLLGIFFGPLGLLIIVCMARRETKPSEFSVARVLILAAAGLAALRYYYVKDEERVDAALAAPAVARTPAPSTPDPIAVAQQEALRRYPELGVVGSRLNRSYLARYRAYQLGQPGYFRDPQWPIKLATEVARESP